MPPVSPSLSYHIPITALSVPPFSSLSFDVGCKKKNRHIKKGLLQYRLCWFCTVKKTTTDIKKKKKRPIFLRGKGTEGESRRCCIAPRKERSTGKGLALPGQARPSRQLRTLSVAPLRYPFLPQHPPKQKNTRRSFPFHSIPSHLMSSV